ncbi:hypothetical protein [Nocardia alba]|uniref:PPE family protein n=1 Tax=Nocardia alba TaxID=225051 RepID=A0A4R1FJY9_9NOCA|nr:hypothetical protein [Nocardia alba]TCJ93594.1 hypothetical protein DFR71_5444 [Nocardia alba]
MTYEDYKSKVIAAQEQWNSERARIYDRQRAGDYATIFGGDLQPPHITTPDNYDSMTLEQMQAAVTAMKPRLVDDAVTAWANIGGALMGTFTGFNQQFARTIAGADGHSGWTGAAASAAVAAVNNYAQQSIPLSQAATAISLKLTEMRTGIEQTQALMPGLTERTIVTGKALPADGVMKVDDHNRDEATQEGRRILRTVYSQVAGQTDNGVPFLPTAPTITGDSGGPSSDGATNTVDTRGDSTIGGTEPEDLGAETPADDAVPEVSGTEPTETTTSSTDPDSTTPQSSTTTTQSTTPTTTAQNTAAASTTAPTSPATTTPGVGTPGAGAPGSGRPTGSGVGSSGSPRGSGTPAGTSSRGTPGAPSPAATAPESRAGVTSAAARGAAGMGAMGAPGAGRGTSDDERTKAIPDYLITQENGVLLLGADQIRTVPPVIGGDDDSAAR